MTQKVVDSHVVRMLNASLPKFAIKFELSWIRFVVLPVGTLVTISIVFISRLDERGVDGRVATPPSGRRGKQN